ARLRPAIAHRSSASLLARARLPRAMRCESGAWRRRGSRAREARGAQRARAAAMTKQGTECPRADVLAADEPEPVDALLIAQTNGPRCRRSPHACPEPPGRC